MEPPPAKHYRYFTKECPCVLEGRVRHGVLARFAAAGTRALMYLYYCVRCGYPISEYIPHKLIGTANAVDLDAWCPSSRANQRLRSRFAEIPGVLKPATVLAPVPGEVPTETLATARADVLDYYVDEAGDTTLFGRKRKVLVGTPGCTHTFALGAACIADYQALATELLDLRTALLADPEFQDIPSLDPARSRTARQFHASKDHPRVRERVFGILARHNITVLVVVRRKATLAADAIAKAKGGVPLFRWQREYDSMVARLFKDRLHLAKQTNIVIARRGASNRDAHLRHAVSTAKERFERKWGVTNPQEINTTSGEPADHPGLQVVDYYLWALQRVFELADFSYFDAHRTAYRLVIDIDDRRARNTGEYYTAERPLSPELIMPFEG